MEGLGFWTPIIMSIHVHVPFMWDFAFPIGLVVYSIECVKVWKFGVSFILPPSLLLLP